MLGDPNVGSTIWLQDSYPVNKSTKLHSVHAGLAKKRDIEVHKTRGIDSGHKIVQVLASSSIFKVGKSRENNAFSWWRQAKVVTAGREGNEME